jgi:hypothetical protein
MAGEGFCGQSASWKMPHYWCLKTTGGSHGAFFIARDEKNVLPSFEMPSAKAPSHNVNPPRPQPFCFSIPS